MAISVTGKIIIDTNVFISYLRAGLHEKWIEGRVQETSRFLSSVVIFELMVGATNKKRVDVIGKLIRSFPKNRIVSPSDSVYRQAANVFCRLFGSSSEMWPMDRLRPVNDILIAVTAFRIGATVITENREEFARIAAHLPGFRFFYPN